MRQFLVFLVALFIFIGFSLPNQAKAETLYTMDTQNHSFDITKFGAKANDNKDDSQAIINAIRTADSSGGGTVYIPAGTYHVTTINVAVSHPISIVGEQGAILDGRQSTQQSILNIGGSRGGAAPLLADAVKGNKTALTNLPVVPGDIVLIHSSELFNPARNYYYRGEMAEVASVSGDTITFKNGLFDTYHSASTVLYKLNMPNISITNLNILRDSNHVGLTVNYARSLHLAHVEVSGARERGIGLSYIYGGAVENNEVSDCWYEGSGTSYGLSIASSQHLTVKDNWMHGGRHGISLGGQEPVRDILLTQNVIDNYRDSRVGAFNTHENVEYITISENQILNGVSVAGDHLTFDGNTITSRVDYPGIIVKQNSYTDELVVRNNKITAPNYGILLETYLPSLEMKDMIVEGNTIRSKSAGIGIKPRMETATGTKIKNVTVKNNDIISTIDSAISIRNYGQTAITVENLKIEGGTYNSVNNKGIFAQIPPSAGNFTISNATIGTEKEGEYGMLLINFNRIAIDHSNLQGPTTRGYGNYFQHANHVVITNSKLNGWKYKNGVKMLNVSNVQLGNNTYTNTPS
ncbi:right-handed parallel beta-helix repeat-containing protein [Aneurinibacillus migulanus]|uniref:right-handed parallel beta-helix repeat-containing protein n=1 Tax=Aneurinibacillus migulanus TaxID=47500 RepID=UPI00209DB0ED|nr:right-handed parallel beta-helix repeat-containing protein [Aneurinibacillus migulanus]MCP1357482.1 right-handed parallel beta-helix repeat-containing protein [Aneurinibacillus migulanus]